MTIFQQLAILTLKTAAATVGVFAAVGAISRLRKKKPNSKILVPGCGVVNVKAVTSGSSTFVTLDWEAIFGALSYKIPFSSATITADGTIYVAGTIGLSPPRGGAASIVLGGPRAEAYRIMQLIEAKLAACGAGPENITMVHCFLVNFSQENFLEMNAGYLEYWADRELPPRITTGCSGLALGALVEIDVVAKT
eukprot:5828759-Pleurochrysis_carterae.AAC.3